METKIFCTTNAGLYFSAGKTEILIDGIHDAGLAGFHAMPEEMIMQAELIRKEAVKNSAKEIARWCCH